VILLIESDEKLANSILGSLSQISAVNWAKNTIDALAFITNQDIQLIIIGSCNRQISALEIIALLYRLKNEASIILVNSTTEEISTAIKLGVKSIISSLDSDLLVKEVQTILSRQRTSKEPKENHQTSLNFKTLLAAIGVFLIITAQFKNINWYLYGGISLIILATRSEVANFFRDITGHPIVLNPDKIPFNTKTFLIFSGLVGTSYGFYLNHEGLLVFGLNVVATAFNLPTGIVDNFVNSKKK